MKSESPKNTFDDIDKRFHSLDSLAGSENFNESEVAQKIRKSAEEMMNEVKKLNDRREFLLYKDNLTKNERLELGILNEIAYEIIGLQEEINDFLADFDVSKDMILKRRGLKAILRLRKQYSISNIEIFEAIDYRFNKKDLNCLSELRFSDEEVKDLVKYGLRTYENTFILLKYCILTDRQKNIALKSVPNNMRRSTTRRVAIRFLLEVDLPNNIQELIIRNIEKFSENPSNLHRKCGDYLIDTLSSKFLDDNQKRRIVACIVQISSSTDCEYLLKHYAGLLTPELKKVAQKKVENGMYTSKLGIPNFHEMSLESIEGKRVNFITHPFYGIPFDAELWSRCEGSGLKYFQGYIVNMMREALSDINQGNVSESYFKTLRLVAEYKKYISLPIQKDTVSVFLMQRNYDDESKDEHEPFISFFREITKGVSNIYYLETGGDSIGFLNEFDLNHVDNVLPNKAEVTLSGGNIHQCLSNTVIDISNINDEDRTLTKDYSDSFHVMKTKRKGEYLPLGNVFLSDNPELKIVLPKKDFQIRTIDDVMKIIDLNQNFNQKYQEYVMNYFVDKEKEYPMRWKQLLIRHRF